jgi:hypothetical protein
MNIRNLTLILLMTLSVTLAGCVTLDGLVSSGSHEEQAHDPKTKQPWYLNSKGELTHESIDSETGLPNEPHMVRVPNTEPNGAVNAVSSFASSWGPWGAFAAALIGGSVTTYLKWRRAKILGLDLDAAEALNAFLVGLIEKVKTGSKELIDAGVLTFVDGKPVLNPEAFREWLRKQGKEFSDPEYLAAVVKSVTEAL